MSTVEIDRPVEEAGRSARAVLLLTISRVLMGAGLLVGVAVVVASRQPQDPLPAVPVASVRATVPTDGLRMAPLVRAVADATTAAGADLAELQVTPETTGRARVALRVIVGTGPAPADRVVAALRREGLVDPAPASVVPTSAGTRLDLTATAPLSTAPLPPPPPSDGRPLGNTLDDLVGRSGAALVRLSVPQEPGGAVRLQVSGDVDDIAGVLDALEAAHTAPARFEQVLLRGRVGAAVATIVFRERPAAPDVTVGR